MPYNSYEATILGYFSSMTRLIRAQPLYLGGSTGAGGGVGGPPGGFVGQLAQSYVTYDTTEAASGMSDPIPASGLSLLHNLNTIRYRITDLEASGIGSTGMSIQGSGVELVEDGITVLNFANGLNVSIDDDTATITNTTEGGGGSPGGDDKSIQFNDSDNFGGAAELSWDKVAKILNLTDGFFGIDVPTPVSPLELAGNIYTSSLKIGEMELQDIIDYYIVFGRNVYYDDNEGDWIARVTGNGESLRMGDGIITLNTFGSESAGSTTSEFTRLLLKHNGDVGLGSSEISGVLSNLANAIISINGGRVGINVGNAAIPGQFSVAGDSFFGDNGNTHYASFADDGELTLFGTARVQKHIHFSGAALGRGAVAPTERITEEPYVSYTYGVNDDSNLSVQVPDDIDFTVEAFIKIHWYTHVSQTDDEVKWQAIWNSRAPGETINVGSTTDTTADINCPAQYVILESIVETIPANSMAHGDIFGLDIKRIAIADGTDPAVDSIHIVDVEVEYTSNKLGETT